MSDIKWIKLATCMPDDEKIKLIDAMPERDTIHYIWIRLLIQAGKTNADGEIFLSEDMPWLKFESIKVEQSQQTSNETNPFLH